MNVALVRDQHQRVRSLSGFNKTHRVPEVADARAEAFVGTIASQHIDEDLESHFTKLRRTFRFKRGEMMVATPGDGTGTIATPFFEYSISVGLQPEDPSYVVWHRQVASVRKPETLLSDEFAEVFGDQFNTVELTPASAIDVEAFIDRIEEIDDDRFSLEYDKDATWCRLTIEGVPGEIEVTERTFSVVHQAIDSPRPLFDSFLTIRTMLMTSCNMRALFDDDPMER